MNKKKIIKIGIPVAAGCIVLALGIGFAVKNSGKAVKVAPVSSMNSGGWYDNSGIASYGTVTTNQKQDIYVDDTMPITQVYVKAGDTVKVGDRLVAYDTTLSSLELEMKEMQIQGIDLNIQNLQKEITQLKGTKTAKADTGASVVQTSADGEQQPTVQKMSAVKTTVLNTSKEDENNRMVIPRRMIRQKTTTQKMIPQKMILQKTMLRKMIMRRMTHPKMIIKKTMYRLPQLSVHSLKH